ncbi:hypothetical protein PILCRDRAFT_693349 [Piloderma croceum F 1598]|uniref:Uncharacterized protein n=1 Tax=Piloderma croceum (strain F 1598) TaxID=765440 RepID=A0A0C3EQD9_PILCF|nr:hypothetical protein PILCRDRAFT_693349 [Piloderma croceum F 1598]
MLASHSMSSSDGSDDSIFVFDHDADVKRFRTDWSRSPSPPSEVDSDGHETAQEKDHEKASEVHVKKVKRKAAAGRVLKRRRVDDIPSGDEPSKPKDRADADIPSLDRRLTDTESGVSSLQEHVIKLQDQVDALMSIDSIADTLRLKAPVVPPSAMTEKKVLGKEPVSIVSVEVASTTTTRKRKHSVIEADEASSTIIGTDATQSASTDERTPKRPKIHRAARSTWHIILSSIASVVSPPS